MTFVKNFHHNWTVGMPDFGNSFANNKGTIVININIADTINISGVGIIPGLPSIVALIPHLSATIAPMMGPGVMVKVPLYLNIGIELTFFFIFLLLCYSHTDRTKYVTFILQLIPGIFVIAEPLYDFPLYPNTIIRLKAFAIAWCLLVFFHLLFLHRIYNYARKRIEISLFISTLLLIVLIVHAQTIVQRKYTGLIIIVTLTPLAIYNLSLHIEQLLKKNEFAKLFFPIGVILAVTAAHDGIVYLSLFTFSIYSLFGYQFISPVFQYTAFFIFIGAGLIIVYQYIAMVSEIENMNIILEKKVEERTKELRVSLDNLSKSIEFGVFAIRSKPPHYFSPLLEPKIKQSILYIQNNYRNDISREGLASLVGIHHDYFSKAFKYYTGKSVNEYIYELRIKEAINLLLKSQRNILDIALFVGFDSVKTFNRAFKKITGKNPVDFRK
ncbi:MAG: helix-turn-helix transcriptional regulator [Spirochaetota bacterium]